MVAGGVVEHRGHRDGAQLLLQGIHVAGPGDLLARLVPEDEVAEAQVLVEEVGQLGAQGGGVLVQEAGVQGGGPGLLVGIGGLQQGRQVGVALLDRLDQFDPGLAVDHPVLGVLPVGDDAEQVVLVFVRELDRLLVGGGQEHLGPHPHGQDAGHAVDVALHRQPQGLLEDLPVEDRQVAGVVADAVLDQQDHPGEPGGGVVADVGPVLHGLDDGHEDFRVAVPDEDLVVVAQELLAPLVQHPHFHVVVQQQVDGHLGVGLAQLPGQFHVARLAQAAHDDDQVEVAGGEDLQRLVAGGDVGHPRRVAHAQVVVAVEQDLGEQPVLLQGEGVVGRGHQQDLPGLQGHQVVEDLLVGPVVAEDLVDFAADHQISPWSSMELATFRNPAMLAPFT